MLELVALLEVGYLLHNVLVELYRNPTSTQSWAYQ